MITFRFAGPAEEAVAFGYSPLLETVLSLHVLREPKHHALQHDWVRRMRRLSPQVRRDISRFGFAYRYVLPDFLMPSAGDTFKSFEEELATLAALDDRTLAFGFLRPLWDHAGRPNARMLRAPRVRAKAVAGAAELGADPAIAELIFDRPRELLRLFTSFLGRYWKAAFRDEWSAIEPLLGETVTQAGARIASVGVLDYLTGLSPQLLIDKRRQELRRDIPHDHTVEVRQGAELVLVPSVYVWPHVRVNCDAPWQPGIVYPAPFVPAAGKAELPPEQLAEVLRALADETRLRALQLIAAQPRSTQELAPLVGISEAGLSKHLRLLARAGIVSTRREGYYVLYSLERGRIEPLSETVLEFLRGRPRLKAGGGKSTLAPRA